MPAKKENRNIGKVPAAASRATKIGSDVRLVISQAAPVLAIQPPVLDSRLAIHRPRKARLASGAKADAGRAAAPGGTVIPAPSRRSDGSCSARRRLSG